MSIEQKFVFGIVTVPYEPQDRDSDQVDNALAAKLLTLADDFEQTTIEILDEHGFSELVADYVKKGILA